MADKSKSKAEDEAETVPGDIKLFDPESKDEVTRERGICLESDCSVRGPFLELRECSKRVTAKIAYTKETCHLEAIYLIEALDKCVKDKAFVKLV